MAGGFNPGDVVIQKFRLSGVDVASRIKSFSVYESVMKPYTALQATIVDSADMLNRGIALDGVELDVSFSQPGQNPYSGKFVVTSIEKGSGMENLRTATYTLTGYSRHMLKFPRIQRAYRDVTGTDIASDLVSSYLSPDKPLDVRDPSRGVFGDRHMPYNVNGVQVFKAIRSVLERAVSASNDASAYVFFESSKNMVIDTLDAMLDRALSSPVAKYFQRPLGRDFLLDQVLQNFVILSYQEESRTDRTDRVQAENQQVNPFDMFSHVNPRTNVGQKSSMSTIMNIAYNTFRPPTYLSKSLAARKVTASNFDSQSLTVHVPLNPAITVGEGFEVEILAPAGDTNRRVVDPVSGPLLTTEVRHSVDLTESRMQATTTIRGTHGGRR